MDGSRPGNTGCCMSACAHTHTRAHTLGELAGPLIRLGQGRHQVARSILWCQKQGSAGRGGVSEDRGREGRKSLRRTPRAEPGNPSARHQCPEKDKRPQVHPDPWRPGEGLGGEHYRTPNSTRTPRRCSWGCPHPSSPHTRNPVPSRGPATRYPTTSSECQGHENKAKKPPWPGAAEEKLRLHAGPRPGPWAELGPVGDGTTACSLWSRQC